MTGFYKRTLRRRILRVGYEIGLLALLFIAGAAFQSAHKYYSLSKWVQQTNNILSTLRIVDDTLMTAEASFLESLQSANEASNVTFQMQVDKYIAEAKQLAQYELDPVDQELFANLNASGTETLNELNRFIEKYRGETDPAKRKAAAATELSFDPAKRFRILTRNLFEIERSHRRQLDLRQNQADEAADVTFRVIVYAALISFLVLAIARITMIRDVEKIQIQQEELKRAREEAEKASRSKSEFLANMSHEIRTPMNAVIGMTTLLMRTNPRPDQREYCLTIQHAGKSLLRLIQGVLDLSRIEAGKLSLEITEFSIRKLMNEIADLIRPSVAPGVDFNVHIDERVPEWLRTDPDRLQQVLINLAGNAAKFTDHGEIRIEVDPVQIGDREARLRFTVSDTGVGIPESSLPKLFQPFVQVSPESPREKLGTGLGLFICKRLIEAMKGTIGVESKAGQGSRFHFELPTLIAEAGLLEMEVTGEIFDIRYKGCALVVDDNPANLRVAQTLLEALGLEVRTASDGLISVELAEREKFDVIIMDCNMPRMDGFEATRMIRALDAKDQRHTPIIALTAHVENEVIDRCNECGMDDFIAKPIDIDQLATVIGRFLTPAPIETPAPVSHAPGTTQPMEEPLGQDDQPVARTVTPPAAPEALHAFSSVDFSVLARLRSLAPPRGEFNSSNEVIDELIRLFCSSRERSIGLLRQYLDSGTPDQFAAEAHYFKSSSMSVGANNVTSLLEKLEKCKGAREFPEGTAELFKSLEIATQQALQDLRVWQERERATS